MSDLIILTKVPALTTSSVGRADASMNDYAPLLDYTAGMPPEDPFFQISPALAVGDDYVVGTTEPAPEAAKIR